MSQRITLKMRDSKLKYLNELMEEIGSKNRFGVEHPWSADFLALESQEHKGCWEKTFNQCGTREIFEGASLIAQVIYMLQREGLLKRER